MHLSNLGEPNNWRGNQDCTTMEESKKNSYWFDDFCYRKASVVCSTPKQGKPGRAGDTMHRLCYSEGKLPNTWENLINSIQNQYAEIHFHTHLQ